MNELEKAANLLDKIIELLKSSTEDRKRQTDGFMSLMGESEERIGNVNKMIADLTNLMKDLTEKYVTHLEQVCKCRDDLAEQNMTLLALVTKQEAELAKERDRYEALLKHIVTLAQSQKADTNINLK